MINGSGPPTTYESQPHAAGATGRRRSTIEQLPPAIRKAVATAVTDGATIDEVVALIRAHGGECSRSAVGRHAKRMRDMMSKQREGDQGTEAWGMRDEGAKSQTGLAAIETLRNLTLDSLAELEKRETPPTAEEITGLALALRRIEGADSLRAERERGAAEAAARAAMAARPKGLSPETVAIMRRALAGEDDA